MHTLFHWPDTASLIVRLVLEEQGTPYQTHLIDRAAGELNSPAYRAVNPLGQIPGLMTPDGPMFETAAILVYLCERHGPGPDLAPAPGSPDRAQFLKWLFFTSSNVHPTLLQMFYPERTAGPDNSAAVVAHARARMADYLAILEGVAQARPAYLSDGEPTALGYYIAVLMRWIAGDFPPANYPALHRVLCYLETRPATLTCAAADTLGATPFSNPQG